MELKLKNFLTTETEEVLESDYVVVSKEVFGRSFNLSLIHQVVSIYLINSRQGSKSQKSRSEVIGSNKKPWRQKGTGRARSGTVKSPIWRSGGVTFAAKPKKYNKKINKKMYRGAMKSILSKLVKDNRLFLIKDFSVTILKTKFLLEKLSKIGVDTYNNKVLIVTDFLEKNLVLASRNLHGIVIRTVNTLDPISLINFDITVMTCSVIKKVESQLI